MYEDERLRELIQTVDPPPTGADIGLAKAAGRRRIRQKRTAVSVLGLLAVSGAAYAVAGVPAGQLQPGQAQITGCTVELVAVPAGRRARAVAVDPSGRTIVGTVYSAQWQGNAVRFEDGRLVPYPGATGNAVAVNAAGLLVGYDDVDQLSHTLAWTYSGGKKSLLPKLGGFAYTVPLGVNARGDVVGAAMGEGLDETVPVLWPADKPGTVLALSIPDGLGDFGISDARAVGVADDGTIVGSVHGTAIRWSPDGTPSALPVPDGYRYARPTALRGRYVYGSVNVVGGNSNAAVRWDLDEGTMKLLEGVPEDVTDGTSDGWSLTGGGDSHEPFRVTPEGNTERLPSPPGVSVVANAMSDDAATIVGATWSDNSRPVIWRC